MRLRFLVTLLFSALYVYHSVEALNTRAARSTPLTALASEISANTLAATSPETLLSAITAPTEATLTHSSHTGNSHTSSGEEIKPVSSLTTVPGDASVAAGSGAPDKPSREPTLGSSAALVSALPSVSVPTAPSTLTSTPIPISAFTPPAANAAPPDAAPTTNTVSTPSTASAASALSAGTRASTSLHSTPSRPRATLLEVLTTPTVSTPTNTLTNSNTPTNAANEAEARTEGSTRSNARASGSGRERVDTNAGTGASASVGVGRGPVAASGAHIRDTVREAAVAAGDRSKEDVKEGVESGATALSGVVRHRRGFRGLVDGSGSSASRGAHDIDVFDVGIVRAGPGSRGGGDGGGGTIRSRGSASNVEKPTASASTAIDHTSRPNRRARRYFHDFRSSLAHTHLHPFPSFSSYMHADASPRSSAAIGVPDFFDYARVHVLSASPHSPSPPHSIPHATHSSTSASEPLPPPPSAAASSLTSAASDSLARFSEFPSTRKPVTVFATTPFADTLAHAHTPRAEDAAHDMDDIDNDEDNINDDYEDDDNSLIRTHMTSVAPSTSSALPILPSTHTHTTLATPLKRPECWKYCMQFCLLTPMSYACRECVRRCHERYRRYLRRAARRRYTEDLLWARSTYRPEAGRFMDLYDAE